MRWKCSYAYFINSFVFQIGWPKWDCWLTWRKIIVDTYGWIGRYGWWAFSWKDPFYQKTATYWHFWRDDVSWEHLDSVDIFKNLLK